MSIDKIVGSEHRTAGHEVEPIFLNRWSPRAMSGETIEDGELMRLFEAARWAPSSYNGQPWRFIYAKRDGADWATFFDFLVEGNQAWAKNAAALIVVVSRKNFERNDKPSPTHSFDTGAAWQNLALQGAAQGLAVHAMQGFDAKKAAEALGVPDSHAVEVMVAVGKPGAKEDLPEGMQKIEAPSPRRDLSEIVMEGKFVG